MAPVPPPAREHPGLVDASTRTSAQENLSELLRVSQRLSLALVIRHFIPPPFHLPGRRTLIASRPTHMELGARQTHGVLKEQL